MNLHEISVAVPADKLGTFYAFVAGLHGTVSPSAITAAAASGNAAASTAAPSPSASPAPTATDAPAASSGEAEVDAAGVAWDPARHASTKGKTNDGLWRMKVGVARGEHEKLPAAGSATEQASSASDTPASATTAPAADDEEDEFAAFRSAADTPARTWTDADLSKLCNQAATKTGDPSKVKAIISQFVPEGEVPHSRNVPAEKREAFAQKVEADIGITYAG